MIRKFGIPGDESRLLALGWPRRATAAGRPHGELGSMVKGETNDSCDLI